MKRLLVAMALSAAAVVAVPGTALASWVDDKCFVDAHSVDMLERSQARAYAESGIDEGYEYAGGCWDNDDRDDTPGQPDSEGEGPDCSGFVFKTWHLRGIIGNDGFRWYNRLQDVHGPYSSYTFHDGDPDYPFRTLASKSNALYMDAFAKHGHIGMLYTGNGPSDGTDYILEAWCDACGTGVNVQTYRGNADYVGVRRRDWTPDCYPQCQGPAEVTLIRL
ncbi:MAG TPA: hypothetical protein VEO00_08145 [Actinomycetota bacterium]|nr:hypothetical protein [Actinomycetota bacterium]